jgi:hypothetical protein
MLLIIPGCDGSDDDSVGDDDAGDDDHGDDDDDAGDDDTVPSDNQYALEFDGTDDMIDVGDLPDFNQITDGLSIEAWIKPVDNNSGCSNTLVSKGLRYTTESSRPFFLGFYAYQDQNLLVFTIGTDEESTVLETEEGTIAADAWNYVVATYDGAYMKCYVDGVMLASLAHEGTIIPTEDPLEIGARSDHSGYYYPGQMNQVRIWKRALTEDEIAQQYTQPNEISSADLLARWDMNEGTGTVVEDTSGNGNHGAIIGATWVDITTPPE